MSVSKTCVTCGGNGGDVGGDVVLLLVVEVVVVPAALVVVPAAAVVVPAEAVLVLVAMPSTACDDWCACSLSRCRRHSSSRVRTKVVLQSHLMRQATHATVG